MGLSWWGKAYLYHNLGGQDQSEYLLSRSKVQIPDLSEYLLSRSKVLFRGKIMQDFLFGGIASCLCICVPGRGGEYFMKMLIMIQPFQGKSSIFHRHPLYNTEMYHKLQYDFSSIMHCPRDHFSRRRHRLYTVQALHNQKRILGGDELSELDIKKLEMMFCEGKCIIFEEDFLLKYRILNCEND